LPVLSQSYLESRFVFVTTGFHRGCVVHVK
jgi:hypothetical protein